MSIVLWRTLALSFKTGNPYLLSNARRARPDSAVTVHGFRRHGGTIRVRVDDSAQRGEGPRANLFPLLSSRAERSGVEGSLCAHFRLGLRICFHFIPPERGEQNGQRTRSGGEPPAQRGGALVRAGPERSDIRTRVAVVRDPSTPLRSARDDSGALRSG